MFHALVNNLPAGVFFIQGPRGLPILVNARARQLLGQREDPSAGLEHQALIYRLFRLDGTPYPPEELPVYRALRHGTTSMRDDIVIHRPDGRRVPLVAWGAPVQLAGTGKPDAAVWVFEDLTALRQAEAARRDTEGRLRAVIETMGEGLIVHDRQGAIFECNPAACSLLGHQVHDLRGRTPADLDWAFLREDGTAMPPEEHPAPAVLRTGRPLRNLVLGLRPRGAADAPPRWLLCNALPLGPADCPAGAVVTFADITAYRRAQETIRQSEEKYRGLVESLPLLVYQFDRDLRVVYANPASRIVTGYDSPPENAEATAWMARVHPEDIAHVRKALAAALAGEPQRYEVRFQAKDGSEKTCFVLAQPLRQDEQVTGITTLVVDMTRERVLERELQRSQRLEVVGRLSSGIAHDFNNLLTVVLTLAELARTHLPADHPAHDELRRLSEAGEQAANLAGQLLAFTKQRRVAAHPVEVNEVARRTLDMIRPNLPSGVEVAADLDDLDLVIHADETQLQQVFMNLCLNARDAMPHGGTLRLRTERVVSPSNGHGCAGRWVRVSVGDTGLGMNEQVKARIFEPFFSTKERGTGLGLAVVQQIVESFGGRVEVSSQPGSGARFDVWLPLPSGEGELVKAVRGSGAELPASTGATGG
jgi:PAS domain S-box-containing protein